MGPSASRDRRNLLAVAVLSGLVQIPFLQRGISLNEEGSVMTIAAGLARGEVMYVDRATFIGPLYYEIVAVLIRVFGSHLLVGRIFQALLFVLCSVWIYQILRHFTSARWALGGAFAFLPIKALGFPFWTVNFYSPFAMVIGMGALWHALRFLGRPSRARLVACGAIVGAVLITKVSLGAAVGGGVAAGVALDSLRSEHPWRVLASRAGWLIAGAASPMALLLIYYGYLGAVGAFVDRSIVALAGVSGDFGVAMPGLLPWPTGGAALDFVFRYYPTSLASMVLLADWRSFLSGTAFRGVEFAVKVVYYAPILSIVVLAASAVRGLRRPDARTASLAAVVVFTALTYGSTVYRADFAHLMNVAPPLLVVCVLALHRLASRPRLVATCAACVFWIVCGAGTAVAVFRANDTPVETPRGRLLGSAQDARDLATVLDHLDAQPRDDRILILNTIPLYYYLSGRAVPGVFDLFQPSYLREGDDERSAALLSRIDQIVYNPHGTPTVRGGMPDFAPLTARKLVDGFRVTRILAPGALVLEPSPPTTPRCTRVDASLGAPETGPRVQRATWLMYRVVTTRVQGASPETCFALPRRVRGGDVASGFPMLHAATWTPRWRGLAASEARFEIRVRDPAGRETTVFSQIRKAGPPGPPVEVDLGAWSELPIEVEFCAARVPQKGRRQQWVRAGWGEPRIAGPAGACLEENGQP